MAMVDNRFLQDFSMGDIIDESPADGATGTCFNETILRAGIESIFAIHKFGMENHVALLASGFQVRKALPVFEVMGPDDSGIGAG